MCNRRSFYYLEKYFPCTVFALVCVCVCMSLFAITDSINLERLEDRISLGQEMKLLINLRLIPLFVVCGEVQIQTDCLISREPGETVEVLVEESDHNSESSDRDFGGTLRRTLAVPIVRHRPLEDRVACYLFILLGEMSLVRDERATSRLNMNGGQTGDTSASQLIRQPGELPDLHIKYYLKTSRVTPRYYNVVVRLFLFVCIRGHFSRFVRSNRVFRFDRAVGLEEASANLLIGHSAA